MIGSLPEVLIMRADRPIGSYKPRETLIRLLRRNKILQILSTKRKISRPRLNQLFPIFLQNVNMQYQWNKNVFAFPFGEILLYLWVFSPTSSCQNNTSNLLLYIKATKISVNKCEHIFFFHHLGIETWHFRGVSIKPALLNSRGANNVYI